MAQLPLELGDWIGRDAPVEEAIIEAADVDDFVNRHYVRGRDLQTVGLWVAYGVRARDLMPHRPEVCYPGAGWTLLDRQLTEVPLDNENALTARILTFSPGGVGPRHLTVLNFYVVDGQSCEDVSLLRSRAWKGHRAVRYVAQVQITCQANPARVGDTPGETVREFAAAVFAPLRELLRAVDPAKSSESAR